MTTRGILRDCGGASKINWQDYLASRCPQTLSLATLKPKVVTVARTEATQEPNNMLCPQQSLIWSPSMLSARLPTAEAQNQLLTGVFPGSIS